MAEQFGSRLHTLAAVAHVGRRLAPVDTNPIPDTWRHLTKVDPEDDKPLPLLFSRYLAVTDAVVVGGSNDVTATNTEATFALLTRVDKPVFHEPSHPSHVTADTLDAAAGIAIPQVLNGTPDALVGELGRGIEQVRESLAPALVDAQVPWWTPTRVRSLLADVATAWLLETAVFEAYLVQNPDSAAAREAGVSAADVLTPVEAGHRALVADRYLETPVVYVEYSGTFGGRGGAACVTAVADRVSDARIWYGGGVRCRADTAQMLDAGADTVVVGNVFHDVALEERALFERVVSVDALLDASQPPPRDRVAAWLDSTLSFEDTAAASYLSTVPSVACPAERARALLIETLCVWLRLRAVGSTPEDATLVSALDGGDDQSDAVATDSSLPPARAAVAAVHDTDHPLAHHLSPWGVGLDGDPDG